MLGGISFRSLVNERKLYFVSDFVDFSIYVSSFIKPTGKSFHAIGSSDEKGIFKVKLCLYGDLSSYWPIYLEFYNSTTTIDGLNGDWCSDEKTISSKCVYNSEAKLYLDRLTKTYSYVFDRDIFYQAGTESFTLWDDGNCFNN